MPLLLTHECKNLYTRLLFKDYKRNFFPAHFSAGFKQWALQNISFIRLIKQSFIHAPLPFTRELLDRTLGFSVAAVWWF